MRFFVSFTRFFPILTTIEQDGHEICSKYTQLEILNSFTQLGWFPYEPQLSKDTPCNCSRLHPFRDFSTPPIATNPFLPQLMSVLLYYLILDFLVPILRLSFLASRFRSCILYVILIICVTPERYQTLRYLESLVQGSTPIAHHFYKNKRRVHTSLTFKYLNKEIY